MIKKIRNINFIDINKEFDIFSPNSSGKLKEKKRITIESARSFDSDIIKYTKKYSKKKVLYSYSEAIQEFKLPSVECSTLSNLYKKHGSDKSSRHDYHQIYSPIFASFKRKINYCEIGLGSSDTKILSNMGIYGKPCASLYAVRDYLKNVNIIGADIDDNIKSKHNDIELKIVDQLNRKSVNKFSNSIINQSIIIDDGLHCVKANLITITELLSKLEIEGFYIIEDVKKSLIGFWNLFCNTLSTSYTGLIVEGVYSNLVVIKRHE